MTKNTIMVVSAAVSHEGATFYTVDGEAKTVPVTDYRVTEMVSKVVEAVNAGTIPVEVDLSTYSVFSKIEEESGGFMKFFRVAKNKVKSLLGIRAERDKSINGDGFVQQTRKDTEGKDINAPQPGTEPVDASILKSLNQGQKEAEAANLADEDTTIVAVVGDTPIVGAEALKGHAQAAVAQGETIGFQNLMKRLGAVAAQRRHTVQEALAFLKEMDLPFANDGSIIAYKSLSTTNEEGVFIDNYSKKLKQSVGTLVQQEAEVTDDNRRVLCSNGLHVARKGYLGSYGTGRGHVVCLIKIAPEDVISVPMNEQSKMRVRAYHIVAKLDDKDMENIRSQKSFTQENMDQASLLAKVMRGDHVAILTKTTEFKGGKVENLVPVQNPKKPVITGKEMQQAQTVDVVKDTNPTLDVKAINEKMNQKKEEPADHSQAFILYNLWKSHKTQASWDALMAHRQQFKFFQGWVRLGLTEAQAEEVKTEMQRLRKAEAIKKPMPKPPAKASTKASVKKPEPAKKPSAPKAPARNVVQKLYDTWTKSKKLDDLLKLAEHKQKAKKSWSALGLNETETRRVIDALPKKKK